MSINIYTVHNQEDVAMSSILHRWKVVVTVCKLQWMSYAEGNTLCYSKQGLDYF
jgi:hypothetical protein